jgi:hypothetical protein
MKTNKHETMTKSNRVTNQQHRQTTIAKGRPASVFRKVSDACWKKINELKERVSAHLAVEYATTPNDNILRQAVREADALAATTPFPSLFLPALAEEKVRSAVAWSRRQERIREQTRAFAA